MILSSFFVFVRHYRMSLQLQLILVCIRPSAHWYFCNVRSETITRFKLTYLPTINHCLQVNAVGFIVSGTAGSQEDQSLVSLIMNWEDHRSGTGWNTPTLEWMVALLLLLWTYPAARSCVLLTRAAYGSTGVRRLWTASVASFMNLGAFISHKRQPPVCHITGFSEALMDTVVRAVCTFYVTFH